MPSRRLKVWPRCGAKTRNPDPDDEFMTTPLLDPSHPLTTLLREDRRYRLEAYVFIFEALNFAQQVLRLGVEQPSEPTGEAEEEEHSPERHVSGQELCEAVRRYAISQYGYMAKTVLNSWGLKTTGDFGEVVYNLIRIGQMRKTPADSRADFENVYDFDHAFRKDFRFPAGSDRERK